MNRIQLISAALGDAHREDYATIEEQGIPITTRFLQEAEARISARLETYGLQFEFTDANRDDITSPVYTLPDRVVSIRYLFVEGCAKPLTRVDETLIAQYSRTTRVHLYAVRANSIIVAGVPAEGTTIRMHYFGLPEPLVNDTDTNKLLNDYPQLYKDAMQVSIYKRAENYDAASIASSSAQALIDEINRKVKKGLGGKQSANPYNVSWRSSY